MSYELVWEPNGVLIRFSGQVACSDPLHATIAYGADDRFESLRYVIADYSAITGCDATPKDIDEVWAQDFGARMSNPKIRKAVVTTSDAVLAMARSYASSPEPAFPVKVFATLADARTWLGATG